MKRIKLINYNLSVSADNYMLSNIIKLSNSHNRFYVCVANVHMFMDINLNDEFNTVVNNTDLVISDGMPITNTIQLLYSMKQERVYGMDLLPDLLKVAEKERLTVYGVDGDILIHTQFSNYVHLYHPSLDISGLYNFSVDNNGYISNEQEVVSQIINAEHPVFVFLGCTKQEKFMSRIKGKMNGCVFDAGGVLPLLLEIRKRVRYGYRSIHWNGFVAYLKDPKDYFISVLEQIFLLCFCFHCRLVQGNVMIIILTFIIYLINLF